MHVKVYEPLVSLESVECWIEPENFISINSNATVALKVLLLICVQMYYSYVLLSRSTLIITFYTGKARHLTLMHSVLCLIFL